MGRRDQLNKGGSSDARGRAKPAERGGRRRQRFDSAPVPHWLQRHSLKRKRRPFARAPFARGPFMNTPASPIVAQTPWHVEKYDALGLGVWRHTVNDSDGKTIAATYGDKGEQLAQLFAAARELLAAAKDAFEMSPFHEQSCGGLVEYEEGSIFDERIGCDCYLGNLRAAIAKATGAGA